MESYRCHLMISHDGEKFVADAINFPRMVARGDTEQQAIEKCRDRIVKTIEAQVAAGEEVALIAEYEIPPDAQMQWITVTAFARTPLHRSPFVWWPVAVVVIAAILWVAYQLNWIRQRHAFLRDVATATLGSAHAPRPLHLFGETGFAVIAIKSPRNPIEVREARRLFPEAREIREDRRNDPLYMYENSRYRPVD